jgi:hypothetical protein
MSITIDELTQRRIALAAAVPVNLQVFAESPSTAAASSRPRLTN